MGQFCSREELENDPNKTRNLGYAGDQTSTRTRRSLLRRRRAFLDPFKNFDGLTLELMLNHLNGRDILSGSEVSRDWNVKIAKSEAAMAKIVLRIIDCKRAHYNRINNIALKSPRKYQNLFVFSQNKKDVVVALAGSLVQLYVASYDVHVTNGFVLPNLKRLVINGDALANGLLNCATNLEELELKSIRSSAVDSVLWCLKLNKNLKLLTLGVSPSMVFRYDLSTVVDFHLTSLNVKLFFVTDQQKFFRFLGSQADSLQHLSIHVTSCSSSILKTVINNMQKLETLEIYTSLGAADAHKPPYDLPKGLKLNPKMFPNNSIKSFHADRLCLKDLSLLEVFLKAVPNLETLSVLDSTTRAFLLIFDKAKKLTEFRTLLFTVIIAHDNINK